MWAGMAFCPLKPALAAAPQPAATIPCFAEGYQDVSAEGGVGTDVTAFILDPETPQQVIQVS